MVNNRVGFLDLISQIDKAIMEHKMFLIVKMFLGARYDSVAWIDSKVLLLLFGGSDF